MRKKTEAADVQRVRIRPLVPEDAGRLVYWKRNASPLLIGYNYSELTVLEREMWFREKTGAHCRYFAIDLPDHPLIGYLGAKRIHWFRRRGLLGIVLDANYVDRGYGTQALRLFLDKYFHEMRMKTLDLEVNTFNARALALYRKFGFQDVDAYLERFENQRLSPDDPVLQSNAEHFVWLRGALYARIRRMRKEWM